MFWLHHEPLHRWSWWLCIISQVILVNHPKEVWRESLELDNSSKVGDGGGQVCRDPYKQRVCWTYQKSSKIQVFKLTWWCGFMLANMVFCSLVLQSVLDRPSLATAACAPSSPELLVTIYCPATFVARYNALRWSFSQPIQQSVIQPFTFKRSRAAWIVHPPLSVQITPLESLHQPSKPPRIVGPFRACLP